MIPELSIIFPCRNEERALPLVLKKAKQVILENDIDAEIIVSDSSMDKSPEIAKREGVILVKHDKLGYGNAYLEAFKYARGKYILMVDADCTYNLDDIPKFLHYLKGGYDMVIGNRFGKKLRRGVMTFSHRYVGNPILSWTLRLFFNAKIRDAHCGIRAIRRDSLEKLNLHTTGMEFASEMVVKATSRGLKIAQFPVDYYRRVGSSKLNTTSDGWRHLRFMLLFSPSFLFLIPGIVLFLIGIVGLLLLTLTPVSLLGITFYVHPMFIFSSFTIIGYQLIFFSGFAKSFLINQLGEKESWFLTRLYRRLNLEVGIVLSLIMIFIGFSVYVYILQRWITSGFGQLNEIKSGVVGLTFIILGVQTIFSAFMLSILGIKKK